MLKANQLLQSNQQNMKEFLEQLSVSSQSENAFLTCFFIFRLPRQSKQSIK
jgi:hypothetical protein